VAVAKFAVSKTKRDHRAVESVVVQRHVFAGDTDGDGSVVGEAIRGTGDCEHKQVNNTSYDSGIVPLCQAGEFMNPLTCPLLLHLGHIPIDRL
jgi:hypothetical protein